MKLLVPLIVAFIVLGLLLPLLASKLKTGKTLGKLSELKSIKRKEPLTQHEQKMFQTLRVALPDHEILAQVAFSALITSTDRKDRNRFDRKVADFVVCTKAMQVVAVIELDDSSHKGREIQDAERDALLALAHYKTIRYPKVPSVETIKNDIGLTPPTSLQGAKMAAI